MQGLGLMGQYQEKEKKRLDIVLSDRASVSDVHACKMQLKKKKPPNYFLVVAGRAL